jgi:hypothetical protein
MSNSPRRHRCRRAKLRARRSIRGRRDLRPIVQGSARARHASSGANRAPCRKTNAFITKARRTRSQFFRLTRRKTSCSSCLRGEAFRAASRRPAEAGHYVL